MWDTSRIFRKLGDVNNHSLGENSSNLVALATYAFGSPTINCHLCVVFGWSCPVGLLFTHDFQISAIKVW
jgi:hypothetical protein